MPIQILPPRLANQIAAGEVVERPASVVKELVENSLDAGATKIDIEIEKGGSKLIRIRDNGKGIAKDELSLALSRHATSKIATLDDLEAIQSLGFRGEALASISSVSRLTLTSCPQDQEQAWAAIAEGREMEVELKPAAHPKGSSIEVMDLFFNTPARRKFLRSDKTEFSHIDEVLRRIALSRFDVSISLKNNGKIVRQYRSANTSTQEEKRLAAVCGSSFVRDAVRVDLTHDALKLSGWVCTPQGARTQSDVQYCYVNGRMMRDKLINHAIRQAYETALNAKDYAAYVLFIELDAHQVDVNVHPAKHEVRFHQSRLVHDFIYQAVHGALQGAAKLVSEAEWHLESQPVRESAFATSVPEAPVVDYSISAGEYVQKPASIAKERQASGWSGGASDTGFGTSPRNAKAERIYYDELLHTKLLLEKAEPALTNSQLTYKPLTVLRGEYILLQEKDALFLLSLPVLHKQVFKQQWLIACESENKQQPLLIPTSISVTQEQVQAVKAHTDWLKKIGFNLVQKGSNRLIVHAVPVFLRQHDVVSLVEKLLTVLFDNLDMVNTEKEFSDTVITEFVELYPLSFGATSLSGAIGLLAELEQLIQGDIKAQLASILRPLNYQDIL